MVMCIVELMDRLVMAIGEDGGLCIVRIDGRAGEFVQRFGRMGSDVFGDVLEEMIFFQ